MKALPIDERTRIIDATGLVLGRMASVVAKRLLNGEKIIIVNAEKAVISGDKYIIIRRYHNYLQIGHPGKGPLHPRRPDRIVKRAIRGMLPIFVGETCVAVDMLDELSKVILLCSYRSQVG
ncbi:MAG: 50S ribosomal protein L13, partial [Candidatus Bathyarchaeia archaeon]